MRLNPTPDEIVKDSTHVGRSEYASHGCSVWKVSVKTKAAAQVLKREIGDYITVTTEPLYQLPTVHEAGNCLAAILESVLTPFFQKRICICGMGNPDNICDSLGPAVVKLLPAMFLEEMDASHEGRFSKLATLIPNVQGITNLEPEALVAGMVSAAQADCLVLIDASATAEFRQLCGAIVVSTAGGTSRHLGEKTADWSITGVPVISVVVPTVLQTKLLKDKIDDLLTVCHIQDAIGTASALIAYALVKVSYPTLSEQDCIEAVRLRQTAPVNW